MDAAESSIEGDGGGRRARGESRTGRRRGSSWAREEGNMTSSGLGWRRAMAFGALAVVVGVVVGLAVTKGVPGHRSRSSAQTAPAGEPLQPMAVGGEQKQGGLSPDASSAGAAASGGSGLNPTTVTPVPVAGAGKANATTAAATGTGAKTTPQGQSNLEKFLDQLGGQQQQQQPPSPSGEDVDTLARTGDETTPEWAASVESSLLTAAAKAQQQGVGGARRFMNFVAIAGCTPSTGEELTFMVENGTCSIITLKPRTNYSITENIVVRRRVTIVGRPLGMPVIDAHNATRVFLVEPTGALDVRFCQLIKGRFIEVIRFIEYHMRGPLAYVRAGGQINVFGCVVSVSLANAFRFIGFTPGPQVNIRIFGGGIVMETGVLRVTDCFFYYIRPGIAFRETQFVGGEFLVLGGTAFITGCIFFNLSIFSNSLGGGGYVANFGGSVVITGTLHGYTGAFVCTQGLGYLFLNGGGTMTVTGINVATTLGMAAYFGGGIGMFTGGGVSVLTGIIYSALATLGFGVGMGFQVAVGGGVSIRTGVIQSSHGSIGFGAGVGLSTYCGSGVTVFNTLSISRSTALLSYYGTSSYFYLGAGVATTANVIGFFVTGCGAGAFGGGDSAVLTGWMTRALHFYLTTTAVSFLAGQGSDLFVGPGGAVLAMNAYLAHPVPVRWANPGLAAVYVAGNNIISVNRVGRAQVIFKIVGLKRGVMDYRNNVFIARGVGWRAPFSKRGGIPGDYFDRQLKAAAAMAAEELGEPVPEWAADYNHLPIDAALARARAHRRLMGPPVPEHHTAPMARRMAAGYDVDVQQYYLEATEGLVGKVEPAQVLQSAAAAGVDTAAVVAESATATAAGEEEGGLLQKQLGTSGGTLNTTAYADHPWFYFANHPSLQAPGSKTDKIYVATEDLAGCALCGVTSETSLATADNVDGPGTGHCAVRDACEDGEDKEQSLAAALEGKPEYAQMWVTDRGAALPNTTIATVYLKAAFTPGKTAGGEHTTVSEAQVAAALNATIRALGLPTRFHLRTERANTPETLDPMFGPDTPDYLKEGSGAPARRRRQAMRAAQRRRLQEEMEMGGEFEGQQECGRSELFKAYVVSDWRNVTDAVARGIRSGEAEKVLTQLLQGRADADAAEGRSPVAFADDHDHVRKLLGEDVLDEDEEGQESGAPAQPPLICTLVAYRTSSLHVPSTAKAGVSKAGGQPLPIRYTLPGADGAIFAPGGANAFASVEGAADDADEDEGLDPQSRAVLGMSPMLALVVPPSAADAEAAAAVEEEAARRRARRRRALSAGEAMPAYGEDEVISGVQELPPRAKEVRAGELFTLVLQGFAPGQLLTLRLVPEYGDDITLVPALLSAPAAFSRQQRWDWRVPASVAPGEYFIEATSQRKDAFAYSQAFEVLGPEPEDGSSAGAGA